MPRWVQPRGSKELVPADEYVAPVAASAYVRGDLPGYRSPVTGEWIEGRRQRRNDLRRHGCVEFAPSDFKRDAPR